MLRLVLVATAMVALTPSPAGAAGPPVTRSECNSWDAAGAGIFDSLGALGDEQMNVLHLAFAGFYGGVNTGFKFTLVGVTRTDNAAWHFAGPGTKAVLRGVHRRSVAADAEAVHALRTS